MPCIDCPEIAIRSGIEPRAVCCGEDPPAPRRQLPARRLADTFDFAFARAGMNADLFRVTAGYDAGGRVKEIFLSSAKDGSTLDVMTSDQAVLVSIALQHGVPLSTLRYSLRREADGSAAGPVLAILDKLDAEARAACPVCGAICRDDCGIREE